MKRTSLTLAICALSLSCMAQQRVPNRMFQLSELSKTTLTFGKKSIKAFVMDNGLKRQEGMMFLKKTDVPQNHGFLFVFDRPQPLSFWMKNTLIPLDIAYLDANGKVLNTEVMTPMNEQGVPSKGNAKYALEMVQGSFKKLGIKAGIKFTIPKSVKSKD
jgi:uncharacterized membrane protein (UPF0127 family)